MVRLFGTDGVRGVAGDDLTGQLAMDVARAAASVLHDTGAFAAAEKPARRPLALVGRDPRASGEFLEAAVVAGLAGSGVDVLRLGVIPTPAVAFLTSDLGADLGVMLSASHNPAPDNGIKLFGRGGFKLPDAVEDEIEAHLGMPPRRRSDLPAGFGRVTRRHHRARPLPRPPAGLRGPADGAATRGGWPAGRADRRGGLRARGRLGVRPVAAAAGRRRGHRDRRRAGRAQHQRRLWLHPPGDPLGGRDQAGCGRRHRARRRRRPLPGGRRRRRGDRRGPDPRRAGPRPGRPGRAARQHRGQHGHVQPRLP